MWNPESWSLESGIQLKESRIPLTTGIQNPSSSDKYWNQEPRIRNPRCEIRIQDRLGFPYIGRTQSFCENVEEAKRGKNRLSNAKKLYHFAIGRVNKDNSANFARCLFLTKKNSRKNVNSNIEVIVVLVIESKGL